MNLTIPKCEDLSQNETSNEPKNLTIRRADPSKLTLPLDKEKPKNNFLSQPAGYISCSPIFLTNSDLGKLQLTTPELVQRIWTFAAKSPLKTSSPLLDVLSERFTPAFTKVNHSNDNGILKPQNTMHQRSADHVLPLYSKEFDTQCYQKMMERVPNFRSIENHCNELQRNSLPENQHIRFREYPFPNYPWNPQFKVSPPAKFVDPPQNISQVEYEHRMELIKMERKRFRNRMAASKCRQKKLNKITVLDSKIKAAKLRFSELNVKKDYLTKTIEELNKKVKHHASMGCKFNPHAYSVQVI